MLKRLTPIVALFSSLLLPLTIPTKSLAQTLTQFVSGLFLPTGVTVDLNNNVYVVSDSGLSAIVSKFADNGVFLAQAPIGGITVGYQGKLATNSVTGQIFFLAPNGQILLINPASGAVTPLVDLHAIAIDTSSILDIASGKVDNFGGILGLTSFFNYGDIAVFQRQNNILDLFVTGTSQAQAFPFVMRLRFQNNTLVQAKVIASSRASTAGSYNIESGIAVNNRGTVFTTLPIPAGNPAFGNYTVPVAFGADFDQTSSTSDDPRIVLNGIGLSTKGMTSDAAGNFYVAGSSVGSTIGGIAAGSGGLYIFPPTLDSAIAAIPVGGLRGTSDVAVNPAGDRVYVTNSNSNSVILIRR
ncbi:hypothetical protein F7734_49295 [Scytonema sp. UIC 10036]|uniref:hypothetical protein n=1 Tax=Scytonema sp. UIC 10036 TaxID=2304196 RepID=UPI0012DAA7B6|nr:hypothetical protein [Scytonema sp. UIC 10036]MUG99852.1 hypothetical protein [Scytonema sp. UIC 10036]